MALKSRRKRSGWVRVVLLGAVLSTGPRVEAQAIDADELAARGAEIAAEDPLSAELRSREPEGPSRRGFDIGMAAAEGDTLAGPGKQRIQDSLSPAEQRGFATAVAFSLERNRNADLAARGAAIAASDPALERARTGDPSVLYWLGFDVATGLFGDPAQGARGNTAMGPGSQKIRDALSVPAQRGFDASAAFNLRRSQSRASGEVTPGSGQVGRGALGGGYEQVQRPAPSPLETQAQVDPFGSASGIGKASGAVPDPSTRLTISAEGSVNIQPVPSGKLSQHQTADGEIWFAISDDRGSPFTSARASDIRIETLSSEHASGLVAKLDPILSRPNDGVWHVTLPQLQPGSHFYRIRVSVEARALRTIYEGQAIVRASYTRMPFWNAQRVDGTIWEPPK